MPVAIRNIRERIATASVRTGFAMTDVFLRFCHSTNCRKAVGRATVSGFSQRNRSGMAAHRR